MSENFIKRMIIKISVISISVVIIYFVANFIFNFSYDFMLKVPDEDVVVKTVEIEIPKGANTSQIAKILEENNLINSSLFFRVYSKMNGKDGLFQYGDFTLNTGMSEEEIADILTTQGAKKETIKFTIPEGYTIQKIAKKLSSEGIVKESEFLDAVNNIEYGYQFIDQIPDRNLKLQGYLFPATYEIYEGATAQDIVSIMLKKFDQVFKQEYYERVKELGYTIDEIITMASIIEREVRYNSEEKNERALVSSVIYNRLERENPMPLQMCSTVMYVLDKPRSNLYYADLEIESPYNTYKYPGLPIGPISNPGEASIKAALYPEDTDFLYFVLKNPDTGEHEFSSTLEEHNRAKYKYNQEF